MAITYPTTLDSLSNPTSTDLLENANAALDHDVQHSNANDAIEALEAKVGANSSAVTTSHDYKLSAVTSTAKALTSGTSTQSVTGLTLVSPVLTLTSDATGDIYYRNSGGALTRLPIGTTGQILDVSSGGIPEWIANPAAADASTTIKGVVEIATIAEITAGTATGATGATLVVPASAVGSVAASSIVQFTAATKYPAADGSLITNLPNPLTYTSGTTTKNAADASTTQNIAHGLGKIPKKVKITAMCSANGASDNGNFLRQSVTIYNGTTQSSVSHVSRTPNPGAYELTTFTLNVSTATSNEQTGVVTFDATNIIITWTKTNSPTGTYTLLWEAEA